MIVQISLKGFCALGGLTNPLLSKRSEYLGKHFVGTTYWYRRR